VFLKPRFEGNFRHVTLYSIGGINLEGQKGWLGLICEAESANYWLLALNLPSGVPKAFQAKWLWRSWAE
jgi:transposase-like protein